MPEPQSSQPRALGRLALIAGIIVAGSGAFAYTAGWFSPDRLTPTRLVNALAPPDGPVLGHRRNHAKGICFTGIFEANGNGSALSRAQAFSAGQYPVVGRFNLGTPNPDAADATVRVRGMGLQISTPDGAVWRAAMIDLPFFPVSTPTAFYHLLEASKSKDPDAMKTFIAANPEFSAFTDWAKSAPWTASYAEDPYNSLNAFVFTDGAGANHAVRWSLRPQAKVTPITDAELAKLGPNHLEDEIAARVAKEPQRWTMVLTVADPTDPTSDPSRMWPAGRRTVEAGTLVVQNIEAEADGPCRDVNFDPTILPDGIKVSDDPFPAARSAAYARSYDLRTAEAKYYPRTVEGDQP
ncbi:catalase family peroxidase [Rhizobiaceae bacterium n13]|uniref:Catalase-related peroxidase n=1 Tax=Ferirhizobium litorale TaxID=2927786 RepID=A0AAE3QJ68_9HYPH|nr:catalase family peroxidase [Fererhizobium litorale]MDI7862740.1 catalase family peroxidase [Fererhizobium litorale]MDI7924396.1 catalase family peroxidase [Fererhizobium litorale]